MVLGPTDGKALAERYGFDAVLVERSGGAFRQPGIGRVFGTIPGETPPPEGPVDSLTS